MRAMMTEYLRMLRADRDQLIRAIRESESHLD